MVWGDHELVSWHGDPTELHYKIGQYISYSLDTTEHTKEYISAGLIALYTLFAHKSDFPHSNLLIASQVVFRLYDRYLYQ